MTLIEDIETDLYRIGECLKFHRIGKIQHEIKYPDGELVKFTIEHLKKPKPEAKE